MKSESVRKIKNNYIDGFKKFVNLVVAKKLNVDDIKYVINKYGIEVNIIKKLISFVCVSPNIIIYLNTYLNKLGDNYDLIEFIKTWRFILSSNNILDSRRFLYFKSTDKKDNLQMKIISLLNNYFIEVYNTYYGYNELVFFYNLFLIGKITKEEIHEIDLLMNGNKKTIDLPDFINYENKKQIAVSSLINNIKSTSGPIDELNNIIYKNKLEKCKYCPHIQKEIVPFSGNLKNSDDPIDILIVNLNSNLDDAKNKQIFKDISLIRQNISLFPKDCNWLLINLIPCAFKSKSEIGKTNEDILEQIKKCNSVISCVLDKYNPKFVILIGEEVTIKYIPEVDFSKSIGQLIENKFLPVYHPNSMRNIKTQQRGKEAWGEIQNILFSKLTRIEKNNNTTDDTFEQKIDKKENKIVKENKKIKKNNELLLFDVKELSDGNILMIYIDENGNKVYEKKKNIHTSYIKNKSFKECDIITSDVDYKFDMNRSQKFQLLKLLKKKFTELKEG